MKIGIIGAGNVGTALTRRLFPLGHSIMLSYSRDPGKLAGIAGQFGVEAGSPAQVAERADVIALAVPWAAVPDAIAQAGILNGKILWDCTNPLRPDLQGLMIGTNTSGGEEVARLAAGARVVKGIPPMAELLHSSNPIVNGRRVGLFVAGDDPEAKRQVTELLTALPGDVTDAGALTAARFIEPTMMLLVSLAYAKGYGPRSTLRFDNETPK